jgi:hypothetical protein
MAPLKVEKNNFFNLENACNKSFKGNESSHNTIVSKCNKRLFHSASRSADYRCSAGVLQRNEGVGYVAYVRRAIGLPAGQSCTEYKAKLNLKRKRDLAYKNTPQVKRRKRFLQNKNKFQKKNAESKEGTTYKSGYLYKLDSE